MIQMQSGKATILKLRAQLAKRDAEIERELTRRAIESLNKRDIECDACVAISFQLAERDAEIVRLRQALWVFGEHPKSCIPNIANMPGGCSCGLDEVLRRGEGG